MRTVNHLTTNDKNQKRGLVAHCPDTATPNIIIRPSEWRTRIYTNRDMSAAPFPTPPPINYNHDDDDPARGAVEDCLFIGLDLRHPLSSSPVKVFKCMAR